MRSSAPSQVGWSVVTRDGSRPTLWAISDLHTGHTGNKPITESLLSVLTRRLADRRRGRRRAHRRDPLGARPAAQAVRQGHLGAGQPRAVDHQPRSDADLRQGPLRLPGQHVRRDGHRHPRAPVSGVDRRGRPGDHRADVPAVRLHLPAAGRGDQGRGPGHRPGTQRGGHRRVPAVRPSRTPPATPGAATGCPLPASGSRTSTGWTRPCWSTTSRWCASPATRCSTRSSRCGAAPPRPPTGTPATTRSARSTATCTSRAPPGTTVCGFEEVSVGYPREWRRRKPYRWLRQILPDPKYAPGYLNEFGGHFEITQEMRDHAEKVQERIRARQS